MKMMATLMAEMTNIGATHSSSSDDKDLPASGSVSTSLSRAELNLSRMLKIFVLVRTRCSWWLVDVL